MVLRSLWDPPLGVLLLSLEMPYKEVTQVTVFAGRQLTGAERTCPATAEETDIDAVDTPGPGRDMLGFSRGVTDLDAVTAENSTTSDTKVHVTSRFSLLVPPSHGGLASGTPDSVLVTSMSLADVVGGVH